MPRMKILSGTQTGAIVEMSDAEAQSAYCTGFAELAPKKEKKTKEAPKLEPEPKAKTEEPKREKKAKG